MDVSQLDDLKITLGAYNFNQLLTNEMGGNTLVVPSNGN